MQRRTFIRPSVADAHSIPLNAFGKLMGEEQAHRLFIEGTPSDASRDLSKMKTQTSLVRCKGQEVKIHAIQTGSVAVKRSHLTDRTLHFLTPLKISLDKHFTEFMPIWVWVIEHPEGIIVIDTGENAEVMDPEYFLPAGKLVASYSKRNLKFHVRKENEIGFQLAQLGIKNEWIKNVVLTHLHLDHTDGLKDFRGVEIILSADEWKNPTGHFPELVPDGFNPRTIHYKKDFVEVFDQAYPITEAGDMLLVPTPGHTRHHASVLFKTDDFDILFAGDVSYHQQQLLEGDLPGINVDYRKSRKSFQNIISYAKEHHLIYLPSHDKEAAQRLREKQFLI